MLFRSLNAVGLPFVFDRQVLDGHVAGTADASDQAYESGAAVDFAPLSAPSARLNEMPIQPQVFDYQ